MPVIAPHYFNVRLSSVTGDSYKYKAEVSVNSKGIFSISVPTELSDACEESAEGSHSVSVQDTKKGTVVCSNDKTLAVELIEQAILLFAKAETTTEIVIVYTSDFRGKYCVGPNGEIAADGYDVDDNFSRIKDAWTWSGDTSATTYFGDRDVIAFGIGAQVYKKTTIKRTTGTTLKYEKYWGDDSADHFSRSTYCARLNSFDISFGLANGNHTRSDHKEIPYTEAAAQFFFEAMVGLCSLNERVNQLFGDSETLQKTIESRSAKLLGAG